jgi:hypothetical protein
MLFCERQSAKLSDISGTCHPERNLAIREANRETKSKACPELVEGDPMLSRGTSGNAGSSKDSLPYSL